MEIRLHSSETMCRIQDSASPHTDLACRVQASPTPSLGLHHTRPVFQLQEELLHRHPPEGQGVKTLHKKNTASAHENVPPFPHDQIQISSASPSASRTDR